MEIQRCQCNLSYHLYEVIFEWFITQSLAGPGLDTTLQIKRKYAQYAENPSRMDKSIMLPGTYQCQFSLLEWKWFFVITNVSDEYE